MIEKKVYKNIVRPLLFSSLIALAVGIILSSSGSSLGLEVLKLGFWLLITIPLIPILTLFYKSFTRGDIHLIIAISIILIIIMVNLYYYGFNHLPFL